MAENKDLDLDFDYTPDIYTLVDEEGEEQQFELLDEMEIDDERYFALQPYFENMEDALNYDGGFVILKEEIVDGEAMMASIDDDDEYDRIGAIFLEKLADMYEEAEEEIEDELQ